MYNKQIQEILDAVSLSEFDADLDAELFELSPEELTEFDIDTIYG